MCRFTEQHLPAGTKIRVDYFTRLREPVLIGAPLWRTTARLLDTVTNEQLAVGRSECSGKDVPNKKIGRAIAVGRALKSYATGPM